MKKIYLILLTVSLNALLFSCSPETLNDNEVQEACCGEKGHKPPPDNTP